MSDKKDKSNKKEDTLVKRLKSTSGRIPDIIGDITKRVSRSQSKEDKQTAKTSTKLLAGDTGISIDTFTYTDFGKESTQPKTSGTVIDDTNLPTDKHKSNEKLEIEISEDTSNQSDSNSRDSFNEAILEKSPEEVGLEDKNLGDVTKKEIDYETDTESINSEPDIELKEEKDSKIKSEKEDSEIKIEKMAQNLTGDERSARIQEIIEKWDDADYDFTAKTSILTEEEYQHILQEKIKQYDNNNDKNKSSQLKMTLERIKNSINMRNHHRFQDPFNVFMDNIKGLSIFSGHYNENFERWLHDLDSLLILSNNSITDDQIFYAVQNKLEGGPYEIHWHHSKKAKGLGKKPSWIELKKELENIYISKDKSHNARYKILRIRRGMYENIHGYNDAFNQLISTIGYNELTDKEILGYYYNGLADSNNKILENFNKFNTLQEAMSAATYHEDKIKERGINYMSKEINKYSPNSQKGDYRMERKNGNGKYQNKGSKNNNSNNYYKKKKPGRQDYNDIECYHCKKRGHIKRNCPSLRNNRTEKVYNININQESSLPNSMVNIDGQKLNAVFDTGAECSVMSMETYNRFFPNHKIQATNVTIKVASDDHIKPVGETEIMTVVVATISK